MGIRLIGILERQSYSIITVCTFVMLFTGSLHAQTWNRIGLLPGIPTAGFFWDGKSGFVGMSDSIQNPGVKLFRTTDGATWTEITLPDPLNVQDGVITSIHFESCSHGWFSYYSPLGAYHTPGIYETTDSGSTWVPRDSLQYASVKSKNGVLYISDGGIAALTDSICMVSNAVCFNPTFDTFQTYVTLNAGKTWKKTPLNGEAWGIYAQESSGIFFAYPEALPSTITVGGIAQDSSCLWYTTDTGSTWREGGAIPVQSHNINGYITGDIEGYNKQLYVQGVKSGGIYISRDEGKTWNSIGGPVTSFDRRFCVIPTCVGVTLVAFDANGGVWRCIGGGDVPLPEHSTLVEATAFNSITACEQTRTTVRLHSNDCPDGLQITSATIETDTTHFSFTTKPGLPLSLGGASTDSFQLTFSPIGSVGKFSAKLHLQGLISQLGCSVVFDTSLSLDGISTSISPRLFANSNSFDFGTIGTCNSGSDTSFTLVNKGCGPDTITALNLTGLGFTWLRDSLPIVVKPGDSVSFRFHFMPPGEGAFNGEVDLRVTSMGLTQTPSILLNGAGVQGVGVLDVRSTSLQAGSFSFCAGDTTISTSISNTGCDTLRITNIRFAGDATLSYLSSTHDTLLAPDSSKRFTFYFAPRTAGGHMGTLTFHSVNAHGNDAGHDTTITIFGTGVPGKVTLSVPITSLTLSQVVAGCTNTSDTIWLFDSLCNNQQITVESTRVESAAPGTLTFPITTSSVFGYPPMGNQDSIGIVVYFYPTAADTGVGGASIRVFYHGDDGVEHDSVVAVVASAIPPPKMSVHVGKGGAEAALHAGPGGVVSIPIYAHTSTPLAQIASADIASLDIRVWFNTDLITPLTLSILGHSYDADQQVGSRVPLQYQSDGAFLHLPLPSGFVITGDSLIATLTCQAFVTDTMQTAIFLDPVSIAADANQDVCFGISSDTEEMSFTLDPVCPDDMLSGFVGTHSFMIESIVPNPASNTITVGVSYLDSGKPGGSPHIGSLHMDVRMYDVLGQQVHPAIPMPADGRAITLDVSDLSEGSYYLRISSGREVVTRRLMIQR